jgi:uncharacterized membrane protein
MPEVRERPATDRSIGELIGQLSQDMALLVRQEARLAKIEMQQKLSRVTADMISLAAGGIVAFVGALALAAAVILALIEPVGLSPWLAALVVGAVLALAGGLMLGRGVRALKRTDPAPRRTVETIRDDIQWAKELRP